MKAESILIPSEDVAKEYDRIVSPILTRIQKLRDISDESAQARDRLLPKLKYKEVPYGKRKVCNQAAFRFF